MEIDTRANTVDGFDGAAPSQSRAQLQAFKVVELKKIAQQRSIALPTGASKKKIIDALLAHAKQRETS